MFSQMHLIEQNAIDLSLFEPEVVRLLEAIRNSSLGGSKEASPNKPPTERTAAQQSFSSTPPAASSTTPTPSLRPTTAFHDTHPSILAIRSTHEARVLGALEVARVEAGVGLVTEGHADGHASGPASARGLPGAGEVRASLFNDLCFFVADVCSPYASQFLTFQTNIK